MILIGQYDSPFVRRVGVALTLYGIPFRQEPWSVFGDADQIRRYNPLTRVPTLVLDDGDSLIESHMILDHLDLVVGGARALFPVTDPERRRALKVAALATGVGDKAVSLFYEMKLHDKASDMFVSRCQRQIREGLAVLEESHQQRVAADGLPGHAEIAIACVWRFLIEAHPGLVTPADYPRLSALAERLEALPAFRTIFQPFIAPA